MPELETPTFGKRLIGAHMSIAGGLRNSLYRGKKLGCTAIQIFSKNSNQWNANRIDAEEMEAFQKARQETGVFVSSSHAAYLINLASPNEALWKRSIQALTDEIHRASVLDIPYLILHPGSHTGSGAAEGIRRIASAINEVHSKQEAPMPALLLEGMAGQGSSIGSSFEELAGVLEQVRDRARAGICLDTCHLFAAGHDLRSPESFTAVLEKFDRTLGLEQIKMFHLNDSKKELGCRVDRHEHIGKGCIGLEAFRFLLNHPKLSNLPMVLETPKDDEDVFDTMNLATLRSLAV